MEVGNFSVRYKDRDSAYAIIAPHGGGIEPGTTELAEAIARNDFSFYTFEGKKRTSNRDLHLTATRFDEPDFFGASQEVANLHCHTR